MYRVWYSTESFADYIINHTKLKKFRPSKNKIYESDANNPNNFCLMPDHIRKIMYLDAPDLIVEKDNEPVFSIEVSTEAGTGHNAFQRFARIAASVENGVPAFYIYPEGAIIDRKDSTGWDMINPLIFKALDDVMSLYEIPALLYYFPSDNISKYTNNPKKAPHYKTKGLCFDKKITTYAGCPDSKDKSMKSMFVCIDEILKKTEEEGVSTSRKKLLKNIIIRAQKTYMQGELHKKKDKDLNEMSPLSAVVEIPTEYLINYLHKHESRKYKIGDLLRSRENSILYQVNAKFRGDPYPGCLAAIDYMKCREGLTFEDRKFNLVMVWGKVNVDVNNKTIIIENEKGSTIKDFFNSVKSCSQHNLLVKNYNELKNYEIPRYMMQVRYGSTYSKVKHIRVFSYFADAILFHDGSLWRDA